MADPSGRYAHLLILDRAHDEDYKRKGGGNKRIRDVERRAHGAAIQSAAVAALEQQDEARGEVDAELAALGAIVTIEGSATYPLKLESLERRTRHRLTPKLPKWLLLSVSAETEDAPERALVWVSDEHRADFMKLFEDYRTKDHATWGTPLNRELVANMANIRASVLRDLWQSDGEPQTDGSVWWELWLQPDPDAVELLARYAEANGLALVPSGLVFDTRRVAWVRATWGQLSALPFTAVPVTEIRRPNFVDTVEDLDATEQAEFAEDLADRVLRAGPAAPTVCLLDTGVRQSHLLIEPSLASADMHTVVGLPVGDRAGHGTRMAGLALFGPLDDLLTGTRTVRLAHRLESVKFLPDAGSPPHDPMSYGIVTAQAVALPEATALRQRTYCMTVTAPADRRGEPSLWSASIDALAAGTDIGRSADGIELLGPPDPAAARLIIVSAGNVTPPYIADYRSMCDASTIDDPAQAWNALTVGAHTHLTTAPTDPSFAGWTALAADGDISPHSRTGVGVPPQWPIKPDICMEGGNVLTDGRGDFHHDHAALSVRTTGEATAVAIASANATSAATALASRLAGRAMAQYPSYWPETIRGLIVHSAEWTPSMRAEIQAESAKRKRVLLVKRYGWGVPDEQALLTSSSNAVTMVVQDEFSPFSGPEHAVRHFRLHQLPWPREVLAALGAADVELRITLSYFIEPSAARRGWRQRYAYASHGLRFDLRSPGETNGEFVRRVNRQAAGEEEGVTPPDSGTANWHIGPNQRDKGSLHQDIWLGSGADLAATGGVLAVHAVGGWWKYNKRADRADLPVRYALVLSLRTADQEVDLYTPIAASIAVPVVAAAIEV